MAEDDVGKKARTTRHAILTAGLKAASPGDVFALGWEKMAALVTGYACLTWEEMVWKL